MRELVDCIKYGSLYFNSINSIGRKHINVGVEVIVISWVTNYSLILARNLTHVKLQSFALLTAKMASKCSENVSMKLSGHQSTRSET